MTDDDTSEDTRSITVLIENHPVLDFFTIGLIAIFSTATGVVLVGFGWQMFSQEEAGLMAVIIGGILGLGAFLSIPLLFRFD